MYASSAFILASFSASSWPSSGLMMHQFTMSRSSATFLSWVWNFGQVSGCVFEAPGWHIAQARPLVPISSLWNRRLPSATSLSSSAFQICCSRAVGSPEGGLHDRELAARHVAVHDAAVGLDVDHLGEVDPGGDLLGAVAHEVNEQVGDELGLVGRQLLAGAHALDDHGLAPVAGAHGARGPAPRSPACTPLPAARAGARAPDSPPGDRSDGRQRHRAGRDPGPGLHGIPSSSQYDGPAAPRRPDSVLAARSWARTVYGLRSQRL